MKSKLNSKKKCCEDKPFPKLMQHRCGNIWLMESQTKGTKVHTITGNFVVGVSKVGLGFNGFVDYEGSVTLCND